MKVNPELLKKMLVFGIVTIFLGLGMQPAIAIVNTGENTNCNFSYNSMLKTINNLVNNPEITNIIINEISNELVESAKVSNTKYSKELKELIKNDEVLSEKISIIQNMIKEEIYQFSPPRDSPFLHIYIIIILLVLLVVLQALGILNFYTNDKFILIVLIEIMLWNIYWEYFHDLMDQ
jgi:hypothetical protein